MSSFTKIIRRELADEPRNGAEIGVSKGQTSEALLRAFPALTLYMVDAWATYPESHPYRKSGDGHSKLTAEQQAEHKRLATEATAFAADRRVIVHATSLEASWRFADGRLDFVLIDGAHDYGAVMLDLTQWWPKVRSGGLLCGHDFNHVRNFKGGGLFGVNKAVTEFAEMKHLVLRNHGDIWWYEPKMKE